MARAVPISSWKLSPTFRGRTALYPGGALVTSSGNCVPDPRSKGFRMDIVGIGTEIVECLRVGRMIEQHGEVFLARIYTEREVRFCQARRRATEHFAARWAAKEAVLKALGTPWRRGIEWTDIEIEPDSAGAPQVLLGGATREL